MTAAAAILAIQLLVPPIVGLADNADFQKVMGYVGLQYLTDSFEDRYFNWILTKFAIVEPGWHRSGYLTSETLLAGAARFLTVAESEAGVFDIRVLGALHILLLLLAIGTIVSACRDLAPAAQWVVALLLVFFFTDVGYTAPLNSLYSQTASLLFFLLTAAIAAAAIHRGALEGGRLFAYFLCAFLFVGSKPQYAVLGPLLAAFGLRLTLVSRGRDRRTSAVMAAGLSIALCGFSIWYYRQAPPSIRQVALYHAVFTELLPHSAYPALDLAELELDPSFLRYSGTTAYVPAAPLGNPDFQARFFGKVDYPALLRFYLSHPRRLYSVLERGAGLALRLRPPLFGNFEKSRGLPADATTRKFAAWSDFRLRFWRYGHLALPLLFAENLLFCVATYRSSSARGRLFREGILLLLILGAVEFLVCVLADAHLEAVRHLYVFQAMCDLLLIADAGWITQSLARRWEARAIKASPIRAA